MSKENFLNFKKMSKKSQYHEKQKSRITFTLTKEIPGNLHKIHI